MTGFETLEGGETEFSDGVLESAEYVTPGGQAMETDRLAMDDDRSKYQVGRIGEGGGQTVTLDNHRVSHLLDEEKVYETIHAAYEDSKPSGKGEAEEEILSGFDGIEGV
jgi:hypothetical protein